MSGYGNRGENFPRGAAVDRGTFRRDLLQRVGDARAIGVGDGHGALLTHHHPLPGPSRLLLSNSGFDVSVTPAAAAVQTGQQLPTFTATVTQHLTNQAVTWQVQRHHPVETRALVRSRLLGYPYLLNLHFFYTAAPHRARLALNGHGPRNGGRCPTPLASGPFPRRPPTPSRVPPTARFYVRWPLGELRTRRLELSNCVRRLSAGLRHFFETCDHTHGVLQLPRLLLRGCGAWGGGWGDGLRRPYHECRFARPKFSHNHKRIRLQSFFLHFYQEMPGIFSAMP